MLKSIISFVRSFFKKKPQRLLPREPDWVLRMKNLKEAQQKARKP